MAYGLNVADRTPQVRDAIVVAAGVETPAAVTEDHLAAITALSLGLSNITALKAGDFEGLTALQYLYLENNQLTALPAGIFSGLTALEVLLLNDNALSALPGTVFNGLPSLQVLLLNNNRLTDIPAGVFSGLTSLQSLYLDGNRLSALQAGIFGGLTALQSLYIDNNAVARIGLRVSLEKVSAGQFKAVVPAGAPFEIRLPIDMTNGSAIDGASSVTIRQGSLESETFRVVRTPGTLPAVTVALGTLPALPETHRGYTLVKASEVPLVLIRSVGINPLTDRTPQVRDAIVVAAGVGTPAEVTEAHLSAITALNLAFSNITALKSGDFDNLTALQSLSLDNNALSALPETVFSGLHSLRQLNLNNNRLTFLPDNIFSGLTALQSLSLDTNQLTTLPGTVFSGLTSLRVLFLNTNQFTLLPETVFNGLTSLEILLLNTNPLTALPVAAFEGLASLQHLDLSANALTALPAGVFSGLRSLQYLYLDNNAVVPMALPVSLERVGAGQFKAVAPTAAPFDIRLPFRITNGRIASGATALTIPQGHLESEVLTVDHTFENLQLVTAALETLPDVPGGHSGYGLVKASELPLVLIRSDGIHPLSHRTPQVQDAILVAAGANFPEEVTEAHLSAMTALDLAGSNITSLKAGDFDGLISLQVLRLNNNLLTDLPAPLFSGLPSLQQLDLSTNQLTLLPAGVFSGLTALQSLNLSNNAMDPVGLPISLERVADGQFEAVAPTGAPFDMVLPIRVTNGSIIGSATAITIRQGQQKSETFRVLRTPGTLPAVTAAIETLPDLPAGHSGYTLVKASELPLVLIGSQGVHPPLRDRTPQVRDAIVVAAGVGTPAEVTEAHLAAITSLSLELSDITALNDRDFEGLTALQVLLLNNNALTDLPETLFEGLTSLQYLDLDNNRLTSLPAGVFSGLTALQVLLLNNNRLTALPETLFNGLASLQQLHLSANALTLLPAGIFRDLTVLQSLNLNNNTVAPVGLTVSLEKVADGEFKAVAPIGAPFDIRLPIDVTNGDRIIGDATVLTIPQGDVESETFRVARTPGTFAAVTAEIGTLPVLPAGHSGYALVRASEVPLVLIGSEGINLLSGRTPQVGDAIVRAAGVTSPDEVTAALMSAITALDLTDRSIVSLNVADFEGLTALQHLNLSTNHLTFLPVGVFSGLTSLQHLHLNNNALILLPVGIFSGLASLQELLLNNNALTDLPETLFSGLTSLRHLHLASNQLTFLPAGVFSELTALQALDIDNNAVAPLALRVSLERVADGEFKAVASTGAPFDIVLPIRMTNGRLSGGVPSLTIRQGRMESEILTVTQTFETLMPVTADIGALPDLPEAHSGYDLVKSSDLPLALFESDRINPLSGRTPQISDAIVGAAGVNTAGEVTEDHLAAITALSLEFSDITALNDRDFEGLTSLQVLLLNNNALTELPETVFSGLTALRHLHLESNQLTGLPDGIFSGLTVLQSLFLGNNAVAPVALTISLERVAVGQFKAVVPTGAPFDIVLSIHIADGSIVGGATTVTIPQGHVESETFIVTRTPGTLTRVTAAIEALPALPVNHGGYALVKSSELPIVLIAAPGNANPVFTEGNSATRTIAENTATGIAIGTTVAATDDDEDDVLTYSLGRTPDAKAFRIDSTTGQLRTNSALDYETKNAYAVSVSVSDGEGGTDSIDVTINVTDVNEAPVFTEGDSTTRTIAENTAASVNIGTPVTATDTDGDTLTYTLGGNSDAEAFRIDSATGQLQTRVAPDYEAQNAYAVSVSVSDGRGGTDSIAVTINVTDVNEVPVFTDGDSTTRTIAENAASGTNIGPAVGATDADKDTLTYTLSGDDAEAFRIVSTSGQLQTKASLNYETKNAYAVSVSVSDGRGGTDSIAVAITVTDGNDVPIFSEGSRTTRTIAENTASGENIGTAVVATDTDGDTLTYGLGGTDSGSFRIVSATGQLQTKAALDFETQPTYTVVVSVADGAGGGDSIAVTIHLTDVEEATIFGDAVTTRAIAENTPPNMNIGTPVAAIADAGVELTYSLGGTDAALFSIDSTTGQLQTKAPLDYERKRSYTVTITVSDSRGEQDSITVTINVTDVNDNRPPVFTEGSRTTRSVFASKPAPRNIGDPVSATEADGDPVTYSLGGTDAALFSIDSTTGQLQTTTSLDYNTQTSYTVTITASDDKGTRDGITVTIIVLKPIADRTQKVRDDIVYRSPVSSVADVTEAHLRSITIIHIGSQAGALTSGDFDGLTGLTELDLNSNGLTSLPAGIFDQLILLIDLRLYSNNLTALPAGIFDKNTQLTALALYFNDLTSLPAGIFDGLTKMEGLSLVSNDLTSLPAGIFDKNTQLTTLGLNSNDLTSLPAGIFDKNTQLTELELNGNDLTSLPAGIFDKNTQLTELSLSFNDLTALPAGIFDRLTQLERLGVSNNNITDMSALQGVTSLTHLYVKGNPISDYAPLQPHAAAIQNVSASNRINLNNNPPVFADGDSTTRSVDENTPANTNIGTAVGATDADGHTLTYRLDGTDAASFAIVSSSGQLQTKAPLDYETKTSYTVTVTAYDGNSGGDRITVTINVVDVAGAAPSVEMSPVIPDETALLTNYPNPFNPETWIPYQLAKPAEVTLTIYNMRGVVVRELRLGHQAAGVYTSRARAIHWDGRNMLGEKVATGVYFYTLKAGDYTATRKLLIRK